MSLDELMPIFATNTRLVCVNCSGTRWDHWHICSCHLPGWLVPLWNILYDIKIRKFNQDLWINLYLLSIYFFYKYVKIISYKNTQVVQINTYVWKKFFPINVYFNSKHQFSSSSFLILLKSLQIYLFPASTSQLPLSRGERRYILEPIKFITSFHVEKKKERFISDEGKGNNNSGMVVKEFFYTM